MQFYQKLAVSIVLITSISLSGAAQITDKVDAKPGAGVPGAKPASTKPKPYSEVITSKAVSDDGLLKVHQVEDNYFFEVPNSMLGRDILVVNRITKSSAGLPTGFFGYAGDQIGQAVIRFEKGPNDKLFLRKISYAVYAKDSTSPMFTAVNNSNVQPIAFSFDIKSSATDSTGTVVDITDFISSDNDLLGFNSNIKRTARIGAFQKDKSYIAGVKSFPINVEINTVKTYAAAPAAIPGALPQAPSGDNFTVELNSSFVILPKEPMQARNFDPRVGYFAIGYTDFDKNPHGVDKVSIVKRWRLEPKDADIEKYKRGELVEPKKPIIFYVDPATPKKWQSYLIQGVNDWQKAFEKAGFKNAIYAKMAPTKSEDPDWSLQDARNSAIVYKPSDVPNASGPSISDPRSGEIMESHINWYHNVMSLLRDWYFVQCSPTDPRARKMQFDDELMGQLIRFVSSHEVGHTLGLRHNHGSSSTVPVENLRNKAWVEAHGHTPSIMDYARFNYVAQPEDNISEAGLFPRIGDYDEWAIEWAYRWFPEYKDADAETTHLNKWVIEKLKNNRLWFGTESNPDDPRSQSEQVGDDAMKGSAYGVKNLQRIVPNLLTWTKESNKDYSNLETLYGQVTGQFQRYMGHVAKYIGGVMETPKTVEQDGPVYEVVSADKQKEAVEFLNKQLFATPDWLLVNDIFNRTGLKPLSVVGGIQDNILGRILSARNLNKLVEAEAEKGSRSYKLTEMLAGLKKGIWSEMAGRKAVDIYRRNLQKSYSSSLIKLIAPSDSPSGSDAIIIQFLGGGGNTDKSDLKSVVRAHLSTLRTEMIAATSTTADAMTKYHYQDLAKRIDTALNPK